MECQNASKMLVFNLILLLLATGTSGVEGSSNCPNAPDVSCSAYATLSIQSTSGVCTGQARADCEAVTLSQNVFIEAFQEWFGSTPQDRCISGTVEAAAEAVAEAVAQVWTSALIKVNCDGSGEACGFAISDGVAWAQSTAEAVAIAAAEAGAGFAFCYADIRAVATVLAEAVAGAQAEACSNGGPAEAVANAIATEARQAFATSFASATAESCGEEGVEATASSLCTGSAGSTGVETVGDECAGLSERLICLGDIASICCDPTYRSAICNCPGCGGPLRKVSSGLRRAFADINGDVCTCPTSLEIPEDQGSTDKEECTCTDVQPPGDFTCEQQRDFGKCDESWVVGSGNCLSTCGRCDCPGEKTDSPSPPSCACSDTAPPGSDYTCQQQKDFGKCNAAWMVDPGYCQITCGRCPCTDQQPSPPSPSPCKCTDIAPPLKIYTCKEQKEFGKCNASWMVDNGYCEITCGRCSCPTTDTPTNSCICSDQMPCAEVPCSAQLDYGKCSAPWMLNTDKNPDGYCQITCGRCPCSNPQIRLVPAESSSCF